MEADIKSDKFRNLSYTTLAFTFLLTLFKLLLGLLGSSTLLIADAVYSLSEFINESVKILNISIANKPEDRSHNYGHGKIATLYTGAGATILLLACFYVTHMGVEQIFMFIQGEDLKTPEPIALLTAILTFVLKDFFLISSSDKSRGKKYNDLNSKAIFSRNSLDVKNSIVPGITILGIGYTFFPGRTSDIADPLLAVIVSLYLIWNSGKLFYGTINELIEASLDEKTNWRIRQIINGIEGVNYTGELKTRKIGKGIAINACINVHSSLSIQEATEITNIAEGRLRTAFGEDSYILIKVEPDTVKALASRPETYPLKKKKGIKW